MATIFPMPYASLADFLEELASAGQLIRVDAEVDSALEIAEITRRVAAARGPALLFERVRGQTMAVVTNLLGSEERVRRALAIDSLDEIHARTEALLRSATPQNWFERLKMGGDNAGINKFQRKSVKVGPCQQVVRLGRDIDLARLPLARQWTSESVPAMTAGLLVMQDARSAVCNCAHLPLQAVGPASLAIVDDGHSAFAIHWADCQRRGENMPVAVVLGGDPALLIAAGLDVSADVDAFDFVGLLRGKPLDVVKCRTHSLEVPAEADLVLEGYLDPRAAPVEAQTVGAGGSRALLAPLLQLTAVTQRTHPIFPAVIATAAHGETAALAKVRERMLLPGLQSLVPEIVDLSLPALGGPHRFAFVSLRKAHPFHARQVASALWGSRSLQFVKTLVLVDERVDVHCHASVLMAMGENVAPERDVFFHDGPAHGSDYANSLGSLARHLGVDATAKIAGETGQKWPTPLVVDSQIEQLVTARWAEYKLDLQLSGPAAR